VNPADYEKQLELQRKHEEEKTKLKERKIEESKFNSTFINNNTSVIMDGPNENLALRGELRVGKFVKQPGLKKLREIIDEVYKSDVTTEDEYYSPPSNDCTFDINSVKS